MKKNKGCPLLYLYFYKKMVEKFGRKNRIISSDSILEIWRRNIHNVPRKYEYHILTEMCNYELLERVSKTKYKLLGCGAGTKLKKLNDFFLW